MPLPTPFASVKLPAALVDKARDAAQPMRRSVASQIEYWATLGRALEQTGLSTQDSQALIAREEGARYAVAVAGEATPALSSELDALHGHVLALAQSGALAERAKAAVAENRAKAQTRPRSRRAA
ncbi:TA system antitoxin ParD family protein [Variovorax sp. DT-64]|uniref:TA system antitoxin ParD family protein n=1 Tax=Variovorax sp. DT-64 TaxID=3396160 RepID=UPI003F1D0FF3